MQMRTCDRDQLIGLTATAVANVNIGLRIHEENLTLLYLVINFIYRNEKHVYNIFFQNYGKIHTI